MKPDEIRSLYDYNAWANQRVLSTCEPLTPEQFGRDLGASFRSVRDTLVHILGAEWIWLERWNGRSPRELPVTWSFADLADVRTRWSEIERKQLAFVRGLSEAELSHVIEYRNVRGNRFSYPLQSMLHHVVNHSTYHRGQISSMLRQLGAQPRSTDLLRYLDVLAGNPED